MLLPIIPKESYCILDDGSRDRSIVIPFSGKSILFAYLRGWIGMLGSLVTLGFLLFLNSDLKPGEVPDVASRTLFVICLAGAWGVLFITYFLNKPSPRRAVELARLLNIPFDKLLEEGRFDPRMEEAIKEAQSQLVDIRKQ